MKWKRVKNKDVVDIRGASKSSSSGGGSLPIPGGVAGLGGGAGLVVVIVIVAINVFSGGGAARASTSARPSARHIGARRGKPRAARPRARIPQRDLKDFSDLRLHRRAGDLGRALGRRWSATSRAQLVLYDGRGQTGGCGSATSAVGPFYCPADARVYLDLCFYEDMERQLGAAATSPGPMSSPTSWATTSSS